MKYLEKHRARKTKTNKAKPQLNTCWTPLCTNKQNYVNKTRTLLQTTGGKDEPNIALCGNRNGHHNTELRM